MNEQKKRTYDAKKCSLSPVKVYEKVVAFGEKLRENLQIRSQELCIELFMIHVRLHLASKEICIKHKFNEEMFESLLEDIEACLEKA